MIVDHGPTEAGGHVTGPVGAATVPPRAFIGRSLRAAFREVENEELPEALKSLLRRLGAAPKSPDWEPDA